MITNLRLGNFKAFSDTQKIPIKPITLIFGPNSAGKSSAIHGMVLARHAVESGDLDVHRTNVGGEAIDLGGFRQYVYRRDASRRLEWVAELDAASFTGRLATLFAPVKTVAVTIGVGLSHVEQRKTKESIDTRTGKSVIVEVPTGRMVPTGSPLIQTYELSADDVPFMSMSLRLDDSLRLDRLNHEHPVFREVLKAIVETSTTTDAIQAADFEGIEEAIADLVPDITAGKGRFLPIGLSNLEQTSATGQPALFPVSRGRRKEDLAAAVRFFMPRTIDELIRGVNAYIESELNRLQYLGPLRSYPPRHLAFAQHHDPNWFSGGGYAWDVVRVNAAVRGKVNEWLNSPERLKTPYELVIRDLVGIDQLDDPLWESLEQLEADGLEIKPDYDDQPIPEGMYPTIKDFDVELSRTKENIRNADIDKITELNLVDRRTNTIVSHRDVGIGVSQVLPVLVRAYADNNQIIAIEQPEIHLHPALQADLGDVFIASALGPQKNRFIIETHSEHLILRILRRIRETKADELPADKLPIKPDDVQVLYAQPTASGTILKELRITTDGDFVDKWPDGFFTERAKELF